MSARRGTVMPPRARAAAGWGEPLPEWLEVLVATIESMGSAAAVADLLGVSASQITQVLNNTYPRPDGLEAKVRARLMGEDVFCPGYGMRIARAVCIEDQAMPFTASSPAETRRWRACRAGCRHYRGKDRS